MKVAVQGLSKAFGGLPILSGVDLEVAAGGSVAVLGASGSGKTTLLRVIAGLEVPDAGTVELDDRLVSRAGWAIEPHRRRLGFAFQSSALWPHMTVAQNIGFGLGGRGGRSVAARAGELMERFEIEGLGRRYPDQLSGGQARRVALARALAPEPRCLLCDEPLTSLETELKERLLQGLRSEVDRIGATVVYVTHDAAEARAFCATRYELRHGRLARVDDEDVAPDRARRASPRPAMEEAK